MRGSIKCLVYWTLSCFRLFTGEGGRGGGRSCLQGYGPHRRGIFPGRVFLLRFYSFVCTAKRLPLISSANASGHVEGMGRVSLFIAVP